MEQLAFEMQFVGRGLRSVILANGEIQETPSTYPDSATGEIDFVDREYVITKPVEGGGEIFASANRGRVNLFQYSMGGRNMEQINYKGSISIKEEVNITGDSIIDTSSAYAVDYRSGRAEGYYPIRESNTPNVLRGYTRVMQDGVKNILEIAKSPSQTPPHK